MGYFRRNLENWLRQTLHTRPLVYLNGPRQCGKSTLAKNAYPEERHNYLSFDTPVNLTAAKSDPVKFINSLPIDRLKIIDEVQLVPEIFPYLKIQIDKYREKGKGTGLFLLTSSANLMALPRLAEALVGRMSVFTLLPFSSSEYMQTGVNFITRLFGEKTEYRSYNKYNLLEIIENATFPEPALNHNIDREQWFGDYLSILIQRDVRTVTDIREPSKMIMLFSFLAMRAGGLLNNSQISQEAGLDIKTYERYKAAAINTFVLFEIPAWAKQNHLSKRFTKSPKLFFTDTNLLAYLLRRKLKDIYDNDRTAMGRVFENFIATEIVKNASSITGLEISHFRTSDQKEVDFVLEKDNKVIGIEVKLNSTPNINDFNGLKLLKEAVKERFKLGVVIYSGTTMLPFGEDFWAVPVCCLWEK
ncbi:MAG: ATP-binding protein [Treponema sp.]|nr:ATP-binding protein [Treponema sp.]